MRLSAGWVWVPGEAPQARVLREKCPCRHDKLPRCDSSLSLPRLREDGIGFAVVSAVALSVLICVYRAFDVHTGFQARLHGLRRGCHERQGKRAGDHRTAHKFLGGEDGLPGKTRIAGFASARLYSSGRNQCEILRASCQDHAVLLSSSEAKPRLLRIPQTPLHEENRLTWHPRDKSSPVVSNSHDYSRRGRDGGLVVTLSVLPLPAIASHIVPFRPDTHHCRYILATCGETVSKVHP